MSPCEFNLFSPKVTLSLCSQSLTVHLCLDMDYNNIDVIRSHLDTDCWLALCVWPVCLSQSHVYPDHVVSLWMLYSEPNGENKEQLIFFRHSHEQAEADLVTHRNKSFPFNLYNIFETNISVCVYILSHVLVVFAPFVWSVAHPVDRMLTFLKN